MDQAELLCDWGLQGFLFLLWLLSSGFLQMMELIDKLTSDIACCFKMANLVK